MELTVSMEDAVQWAQMDETAWRGAPGYPDPDSGNPTRRMHEWSSTVVLWLSMIFSLLLLGMCIGFFCRFNQHQARNKPMVKHVLAIATCDFGAAFWTYACSCIVYHDILFKGDPPWCMAFRFVRWTLILQSALWATSLALGVLFVLLSRQNWVKWARMTAYLVIPLSLLFALPVTIQAKDHVFEKEAPQPLCWWSDGVDIIVACELFTLLSVTAVVQAMAIHRSRYTLPGSVLNRSVRVASRYIVAFWITYGPFACRCICHIAPCHEWRHKKWWLWYDFLSWRLLLLNGFFNFVALGLHVRDALLNRMVRGPHSSVHLNAQVEIREVSEVDHRAWANACEAQIRHIQESREVLARERTRSMEIEVWSMFGLDMDDEDDRPEAAALPRSSFSDIRLDWYRQTMGR